MAQVHKARQSINWRSSKVRPDSIHVHQLRHTVARMVGEDTGDLTAVQKVLGHKNLTTTRVYLRQVATKKDTHSAAIRDRLKL